MATEKHDGLGLIFDEVLHKYYLDGKELPSVTTIIRRVLGDNGHGTQWHMDRGSAAHDLYRLLGAGEDLGLYDYDQRLVGNVAAWLDWHSRERVEVEAVEKQMCNLSAGYAGTVDAVVTIRGKRWIIDYKSSPSARDELQLAAYAELWKANNPKAKIDGVASLQITPDGWKYGAIYERIGLLSARAKWNAVLAVHRMMEAGV
jgi:hypothetical protein